MSDLSKRTSVESLWAYSLYIGRRKLLIHVRGQSGFSGDALIIEAQISSFFVWTIEFIFFVNISNELTEIRLKFFRKAIFSHNNRKLHEMKVSGSLDEKSM